LLDADAEEVTAVAGAELKVIPTTVAASEEMAAAASMGMGTEVVAAAVAAVVADVAAKRPCITPPASPKFICFIYISDTPLTKKYTIHTRSVVVL
jgi:hypothetical protein